MGKLALIVYKYSQENHDNFEFKSKLIDICNKFDYETTKEVKKHLLEDIELKFGNEERYWNLLARNKFEEYKQILQGDSTLTEYDKLKIKKEYVNEAIKIYQNSCFKYDTTLMWEYYCQFRFDYSRIYKNPF